MAPTDATVLIVGESGTGKELVAETVHELSRRRRGPFLAVNCGAVSPNLIESELFGHERGSFTGAAQRHRGYFERASGGTLFLDEITEMPLELQVKLLRVLETGTCCASAATSRCRSTCASSRRPIAIPAQAVAEGKLREDLYYRLNVFPIVLPPLRERAGRHHAAGAAFPRAPERGGGNHEAQSRPTRSARLERHDWPGNVRELKNVVQRAYIMADEEIDRRLPPGRARRRRHARRRRVGGADAHAHASARRSARPSGT